MAVFHHICSLFDVGIFFGGSAMAGRKIEVSCYAGRKGEERPRSFLLEGERIEVVSVVREWIEESGEDRAQKRFFRVRGSDGFEHRLYYDEETSAWFLTDR